VRVDRFPAEGLSWPDSESSPGLTTCFPADPMSPENTYTAAADREARCRTCLPGDMSEFHINRHLWETIAADLKREVREAYTSTPIAMEALAQMYGVTELRIRRILGLEDGPEEKSQ
jgi:hypothetical protein